MNKIDAMAKARATKAANAAARKAAAGAAPQTMSIDDQAEDTAPEPTQRVAARQPARTPVRNGRAEVIGRGGEKLSRTRSNVGDPFDIPKNMIPEGWRYQWNVVSVVGNTDIAMDQSHNMHTNGWRPVPAERHAGVLLPPGSKGAILRGGQRLEERPATLSIEAEQEDIRAARQLISDRNESLKLSGVRKQMSDGFEMSGKYRGTGGQIKMSIDPALDIPSPSHTLDE